jgi:trimeric autotransporter adhesin
LGGCCFSAPAVYALAVSGNDLYAAGTFMMAGGSAANRIAKWDGSRWTALGSGISDWLGQRPDFPPTVRALAIYGGEVYAAGAFDGAGDVPVANIAKWNGNNWSALGSGINGWVNALAISGSDQLYAGGAFTTADGGATTNVVKWNGSRWSALGSGFDGPSDIGSPGEVKALVVSGNDLYAAGTFMTTGGSTASRIARWDGSRWSALGSGIGGASPYVYALAVSGSDLYTGGPFSIAGGKVSVYVAKAVVYPPVLTLESDGSDGYFIRFSGVPNTAYRLQRASDLAGPWASSEPQTAPTSGQVEFRDSSPALGQTFYRAVQP